MFSILLYWSHLGFKLLILGQYFLKLDRELCKHYNLAFRFRLTLLRVDKTILTKTKMVAIRTYQSLRPEQAQKAMTSTLFVKRLTDIITNVLFCSQKMLCKLRGNFFLILSVKLLQE